MTKCGTTRAIIITILLPQVIPQVDLHQPCLPARLGGAKVEPRILFSASSMPEGLTVVRKVHSGSRISKLLRVLIRLLQFLQSDVIAMTVTVTTNITEIATATTAMTSSAIGSMCP